LQKKHTKKLDNLTNSEARRMGYAERFALAKRIRRSEASNW